jgi:hypothetical protein
LFCAADVTSPAAQTRFPLVISAGTHSLTVPWHVGPVNDRFNPALMVGTERMLRPGDRLQLYHTANLGFVRHYWWMTALFLDAELGVRHKLPLGFSADLRLGIGYMHYFWRRKSLELKGGRYVEVTNWGRPSLMAPLSLELAYRGRSARPAAVAPFVSVKWALQALFKDEVPAMTHFLILVGSRISLGRVHPKGGR